MPEGVFFNNVHYLSSKDAGAHVGYTHDYISRLAREGKVPGKLIGRVWYVETDALVSFLHDQEQRKNELSKHLSKERRKTYQEIVEEKEIEALTSVSLPRVPRELLQEAGAFACALLLVFGTYMFSSSPHAHAALRAVQTHAKEVSANITTFISGAQDVARASSHTAIDILSKASDGTYIDAIQDALSREHASAFSASALRAGDQMIRDSLDQYVSALTRIGEEFVELPERARHAHRYMSGVSIADVLQNAEGLVARSVSDVSERTAASVSRTSRSLAAVDVAGFVQGLFTRVSDTVVSWFAPEEEEFILVTALRDESEGTTQTNQPQESPEVPLEDDQSIAQVPQTIVTQPVIERVIETKEVIVQAGITESYVQTLLEQLNNKLQSEIYQLSGSQNNVTRTVVQNFTNIANTNKIDKLTGIQINSSTFSNGTIDGDTSFSGTTGNFSGALSAGSLSVSGNITANTSGFVFDSSAGNVGVGTSSPFARLSVAGASGGTSALFAISTSTASATSTAIVVDSQGRLGIGTTSPSAALSVQGDVLVNGNFTITDFNTTGTFTSAGLSTFSNGFISQASSTISAGGLTTVGYSTTTQALIVQGASATSTFAGGLDVATGGLLYDFSTARVGVGTTSPSQALSVTGNGYFTGGLGVGIATTTAGVLETSGNAYIGGNLTVVGDSTVIGGSTADSLTINSTINSNLIPDLNATRDIGSASFFWDDGFFDTITANNLSAASTTISGTQAATFTLNSDNATSDTEDMDLIFFRGTVVPNALLSWDSTENRFDFNQPLFIQNDDSTTGANVTLDLRGRSGQTGDLFRVASSTNSEFFSIDASGDATFSGSLSAVDITNSGTFSVTGLASFNRASSTQLSVFDTAYFGGTATSTFGSNGALTLAQALAVSSGGTGLTTFGGTNTILFTTAADALSSNANFVFDGTNLGIGDATPSYTLDVNGDGRFTGLVDAARFVATSTSATSTFAGGLAVETSGLVYDFSTNRVGIGTASPAFELDVTGQGRFTATSTASAFVASSLGAVGAPTFTFSGDLDTGIWSSAANTLNFSTAGSEQLRISDGGNIGIGTTSPYAKLSVVGETVSEFFTATSTSATSTFSGGLNVSGFLGVGTTSPSKRLSVQEAVSDAQFALAFDNTRYAHFQVDSVGDLTIDPQGNDVFLNDDNLWVCSGGSCPSGTPSGNGNLVVETRIGIASSTPWGTLSVTNAGSDPSFVVEDQASPDSTPFIITADGSVGIGTTTPTQQLSVQNLLFVGAGGASGLGTATSTFQGDIRITGKLDVGTIDPVYTIDGVKYATYGHSTIGIKEEVVAKLLVTELNTETGYYEHTIRFSELEEGSDLWLFYQVTEFGEGWADLVVSLTSGFDGRTFYKKNPETNTLTIASSDRGEVSLRMIASRFDANRWPNLRFDQDDDYVGHVIRKK